MLNGRTRGDWVDLKRQRQNGETDPFIHSEFPSR